MIDNTKHHRVIHTTAGFRFGLLLGIFFLTSSQFTKMKAKLKSKFDPDYKPGTKPQSSSLRRQLTCWNRWPAELEASIRQYRRWCYHCNYMYREGNERETKWDHTTLLIDVLLDRLLVLSPTSMYDARDMCTIGSDDYNLNFAARPAASALLSVLLGYGSSAMLCTSTLTLSSKGRVVENQPR